MNTKQKFATLPGVAITNNHLISRNANANAALVGLTVGVDGKAVDPRNAHKQAVVSGGGGSVAIRLDETGALLITVAGYDQSISLQVSATGEISRPQSPAPAATTTAERRRTILHAPGHFARQRQAAASPVKAVGRSGLLKWHRPAAWG